MTERATMPRLRWAALVMALCVSTNARAAREDKEEAVEEPAPPVGAGLPTRTLAERIPSVTHRVFAKSGRVELYPALGVSLTDPFYRYVMPGVGLNYYILESLAVGASVDYFAGLRTRIEVTGGTAVPQPDFNRPRFAARLQVSWLPLYGKVSWLAESVSHFDTYLTGAVGVLGPQQGAMTPGFSLALGQHYFFNGWLALRVELRDELFLLARAPTASKYLQNLLSASVGLCFYLPTESSAED
jgi:outer membrane beta-barrel protein